MQTRKLLFPLCASVNPSFPRPPLTLLVARFLATDTRSLHVRRGERGKKGATREMEIVTRETQTGNIGGTLISRLEKRGGRQTVIVSTSSESLLLLLEREREFFVASINRSETRPSCARILQMVVIVISVKKKKDCENGIQLFYARTDCYICPTTNDPVPLVSPFEGDSIILITLDISYTFFGIVKVL